ncbi:contractile injection system protein, VgrG/Pvc8 family, partial [Bisbaumannia pacifica]
MADATGLQFTLSLAGIPGLAVVDFTHREALSAPFTLTLTVASRDPDLGPAEVLERNATLVVWEDGEPLRHLHGVVSEFGRGDRGHRRTFYTLVIRPALWRLDLRHN